MHTQSSICLVVLIPLAENYHLRSASETQERECTPKTYVEPESFSLTNVEENECQRSLIRNGSCVPSRRILSWAVQERRGRRSELLLTGLSSHFASPRIQQNKKNIQKRDHPFRAVSFFISRAGVLPYASRRRSLYFISSPTNVIPISASKVRFHGKVMLMSLMSRKDRF